MALRKLYVRKIKAHILERSFEDAQKIDGEQSTVIGDSEKETLMAAIQLNLTLNQSVLPGMAFNKIVSDLPRFKPPVCKRGDIQLRKLYADILIQEGRVGVLYCRS